MSEFMNLLLLTIGLTIAIGVALSLIIGFPMLIRFHFRRHPKQFSDDVGFWQGG